MSPNWRYILIFILISIGISGPIHLGYFDEILVSNLGNKVGDEWFYLFAGLGPFLGGLMTIQIQGKFSNKITILGKESIKNSIILILPTISFSILGFENDKGINIHLYGFIYSLINVIYSFSEEFGWRIYLQNSLDGVNKNLKYIIIGFVWWIWHLRFETNFDIFIFPLICIVGGYLLGKLTDDTKVIVPVITIHSLIILLTNTGMINMNKLIGISLTIICWIVIEQIWKRKSNSLIS